MLLARTSAHPCRVFVLLPCNWMPPLSLPLLAGKNCCERRNIRRATWSLRGLLSSASVYTKSCVNAPDRHLLKRVMYMRRVRPSPHHASTHPPPMPQRCLYASWSRPRSSCAGTMRSVLVCPMPPLQPCTQMTGSPLLSTPSLMAFMIPHFRRRSTSSCHGSVLKSGFCSGK